MGRVFFSGGVPNRATELRRNLRKDYVWEASQKLIINIMAEIVGKTYCESNNTKADEDVEKLDRSTLQKILKDIL